MNTPANDTHPDPTSKEGGNVASPVRRYRVFSTSAADAVIANEVRAEESPEGAMCYWSDAERVIDRLRAQVEALRKELAEARSECEEQARLLGAGGSRGLRLMTERDEAIADRQTVAKERNAARLELAEARGEVEKFRDYASRCCDSSLAMEEERDAALSRLAEVVNERDAQEAPAPSVGVTDRMVALAQLAQAESIKDQGSQGDFRVDYMEAMRAALVAALGGRGET